MECHSNSLSIARQKWPGFFSPLSKQFDSEVNRFLKLAHPFRAVNISCLSVCVCVCAFRMYLHLPYSARVNGDLHFSGPRHLAHLSAITISHFDENVYISIIQFGVVRLMGL